MDFKKIGKRILFPNPVLAVLLVLAAAACFAYSFVCLETTDPISVASYALSFYALVVGCLRMPGAVRFAARFKRENRYLTRYTSDVRFRINVSLFGAFAFNAVYAVFQLGLGLWHHSVWFYAMAGYYLLLAAMRLLLVRYTGNHAPGEQQEMEWKKYRLCGILLMMITFALAVFVIYFVWNIRVFKHHEITTITMAAYTFAALTMAIVNAVRYQRYKSPVYSAAKAISLASAVVSVLTLENTMLTVFGQEKSGGFSRYMLGATGVAVMFIVQGIAIHMIRKSGKNLRSIHHS